ncbi:phage major capsid protein [Undibacterium baiyunense]|uniref:Phage major capsid protein n=1 Tax=Undibacterium baiyunense TaxID=2828731 RepID=A0A941DGZ9_9BURK|nr:phage major capsid protein [Undibacterium baiyunense]MBR7747453.1 phage major capsid protein [Undibacterium baiyunense]
MKTIDKHYSAFRAKLAMLTAIGIAAAYEKREDVSIKNVADSLDKIATAFDEYKKTNDARLEAIKSGKSTADFDAKLAKIDEAIDSLNEQKSRLEKMETKLARPGVFHEEKQSNETREAVEYRHAFLDWMRAPSDHERQQKASAAAKALEAKSKADGRETRSTQTVTSTGSAGGFALPEIIERQIQRLSVDISPIRQIATVRTVGSVDYKELFDVNGAGFEWVGETDPRNQTNTPDLAEVAPTFGTASAKPQASEESLDDLFFNVEDWLINSAAEAMAQGEGIAFVSGNGTKKPTGFLAGPTPVTTADSARAFGTLQYIASGQAAALPTSADIFYDLIYSLRARYRANAQFVTSKLVLAALRKYKDSQNQYLWQPALTAGQPATFMGYGITEAEDMPAVGAGAFSLAFGDFKEGYLITDRVGMRITRDEITTPGFVKFYVRKRVGGKLRNTQAIKLLKIAAS